MTENEWLEGHHSGPMLEFLSDNGSDRKLRLFACACCRRIPGYLESEPDREGLELTERDVDGLANEEEFERLTEEVHDVRWYRRDAWNAIGRALESYWDSGLDTGHLSSRTDSEKFKARFEMEFEIAALLREIFGNPFRMPSVNASWLAWNDGTIPKIAQAIYDERAFDRLPILADALEDAGCDNADILNHCRQPGEHVRGCWVVDLLLGKE